MTGPRFHPRTRKFGCSDINAARLTFQLRLKCDILCVRSDGHIAIRVTSGPGELPSLVWRLRVQSKQFFVGTAAALSAEVSRHDVTLDRWVPSLEARLYFVGSRVGGRRH